MNCRRVDTLLSDHLEGILTPRLAEAVAAHLDLCPACRRRRDRMRAVGADLQTLAEVPAASDLSRRAVVRWLVEREATFGRSGSRCRPATEVAATKAQSPPARAQNSVYAAPLWRLRIAAVAAVGLAGVGALLIVLGRAPHPTPAPRPDEMARVVAPGGGSTQIPGSDQHVTSPARPGVKHRAYAYEAPPGLGQPASSGLRKNSPAIHRRDIGHHRVAHGHLHGTVFSGDLAYFTDGSGALLRHWTDLRAEAITALEARLRALKGGDDFVAVPLPRLAATGPDSDRVAAEAVATYQREKAVVDSRLFRKVTLAFKATALSDLCDHLRNLTGIALAAGQSVADEKVTLFCKGQPLRDVMRQLSRPFGYTWLRSGKPGEYKYELTQDLRSQLLEEELRDRDRRAALLSLEKEIERFRPYRGLSPDEILARAKSAPPAEKDLLEKIGGSEGRSALGWGPVQMYFRLSAQELAALRAGETLYFSEGPRTGERPLPADVARGVLQGWRQEHILKTGDRFRGITDDLSDPNGIPVTTVPGVRAAVSVHLTQAELGQYALDGLSGFYGPVGRGDKNGPYAVGKSPRTYQPENAAANAGRSRDHALQARVSILTQASCRPPPTAEVDSGNQPEPKTTSADVLEALHRATGLPLVADYYTRLFKPASVSVRQRPLFDALNQLSDATRMRWNKEAGINEADAWLQFRSTSFYDDRLKEVPNRLLARWAAARRERGALTLDDLVEIAQLSDAQLEAEEMAEGARDCFGLAEWVLPHTSYLRTQLRYLAQFTPAQRQEMQSPAGLPFTRMSLAQQQGFLRTAFPAKNPGTGTPFTGRLESLEDLSGALLRVDYSLPGGYEWRPPGRSVFRWFVPMTDGARRWAVPCPVVRERTREAALAALRRVDPAIREALRAATERDDPGMAKNPVPDVAQIVPTQLGLALIYLPGTPDKYSLFIINRDYIGRHALFPEPVTTAQGTPESKRP